MPVVIWMVLIFLLSSQSSLPGPQIVYFDFIFKKSAHVFVYAVLYFLFFRAINGESKKYWFIPFLCALAYAVSDEYHQSFTPFRTARMRDVGFDVLGMFIAYLSMKRYI